MAISFIAQASASTTTVSLPGTAQAGDLAIVAAGRTNTGGPSIPGDWNDLGVVSGGSGGSSHGQRLGWKILTAADITAGNIGTWTGASEIIVGIYRGSDGAHSTNHSGSGVAGTTMTFPSRSTIGSGSWVVALGTHRSQTGTTLTNSTHGGNYTNRSSGTTSPRVYLGDRTTTPGSNTTITGLTSSGNVGRTVEITEAQPRKARVLRLEMRVPAAETGGGDEFPEGSDSASLAEAMDLEALVGVVDEGTTSEQASLDVSVVASDSGSLTESGSINTGEETQTGVDSGTLTESATLQASITTQEGDPDTYGDGYDATFYLSGESADVDEASQPRKARVLRLEMRVPAAEAGDESQSASDAGSLAEAVTAEASISASDSGSLTEQGTASTENEKNAVDSGTLVESAVIEVVNTTTDTASLGEIASAQGSVTGSDGASLTELAQAGPPPEVVLPSFFIDGLTTRPEPWTETIRPGRWDGTESPGQWTETTRPVRWDATERPERFTVTTRLSRFQETIAPTRWYKIEFVREGVPLALETVAYGPFTTNEIPEALLIQVLKPLRAGGTAPLEIFDQTPAYTATVSIEDPAGNIVSRTTGVTILDPAQLTTLYPDDFTETEEGWLQVALQDGDLDESGTFKIQVTLDNGTVRLKSTAVWNADVNAGPARLVT